MSRVIPKEQLAGYQRWQAGSFDKPAQAGGEPARQSPPPAQEAANLATAAEQAGEMVVDIPFPTAEDLARINEEARNEGYQRGYDEGLAAAEAECSARTGEQIAHLATLIGNLQASLTQLDQEIADQLLDLSLEVASQMLRSSLKVRRTAAADHPRGTGRVAAASRRHFAAPQPGRCRNPAPPAQGATRAYHRTYRVGQQHHRGRVPGQGRQQRDRRQH
jgi:hypothetical protein